MIFANMALAAVCFADWYFGVTLIGDIVMETDGIAGRASSAIMISTFILH